MKPTSSPDPAQLVLRARTALGLSQRDFGARVSKSQGLVSKYESGRVAPPAHIVIHCMNILGESVLPQPSAIQGWDAVHTALAQLQRALASVTPTSRRSQRTI
ncbi:helix-turn-helix domain-containing protein [Dokdonella koreensis]|uniref:helix-turn-helix domain-containing protein n=1 Tax=Dokdonella koreensis TaxID=323415 RepID=UPI0016813051